MSISLSNGSATIGVTEFSLPNNSTSLTPQTTTLCLQAFIDVATMAAGDQYQIHINEKINGGTQRTVYESILTGAQPYPFVSPALFLSEGWDVTVKKLGGTDRAIAWSLRSVA